MKRSRDFLLQARRDLEQARLSLTSGRAPFERDRRPEAERLLAHGEAVYAFCEGLLSQMD
jgi:HEPN domain-containing protein